MRDILRLIEKGIGVVAPLKARYDLLSTERSGYLARAKDFSKFTLPYVMPAQRNNRGDAGNQHGFNGIGASLVNSLSNKLAVNMFPIDMNFYQLSYDKKMLRVMEQEGADLNKYKAALIDAEEESAQYELSVAARVAYIEAFKNELITGNCLAYLPEKGNLQIIKLDSFVIKRDLSGNVLEIIIEQKKSKNLFSRKIIEVLDNLPFGSKHKDEDELHLHTCIYRVSSTEYAISQVVEDIVISEIKIVKAHELPYIPLAWNLCPGEDYGRGLVEDHAGDFYVIEFLSEAIAKGAALISDIKYLIKPGSITDIDAIAEAPVGEWIYGQLEDVGILQLDRFADLKPLSEVLDVYKRRVGQAFLSQVANRRDAERVDKVALYKLP